ncbi:MAG: hypothetical protein ACOH5I_22500 [Oligoflexus sp.]
MSKDPDIGLGESPRRELDEMSPAAVKAQQDAALAAAGYAAQSSVPPSGHGQQPVIVQQVASKRSGIWTFALVIFGVMGTAAALGGGFIYGEYYGRHHAQFDNPALRKHYAGECYRYMSQQFSKTVRETFDREFQRADMAGTRGAFVAGEGDLGEIRQLLEGMQGEFMALRAALKDTSSGVGKSADMPAVLQDVQRLIKLMEQNQIQMVADQCPASPNVPRRISSRAG